MEAHGTGLLYNCEGAFSFLELHFMTKILLNIEDTSKIYKNTRKKFHRRLKVFQTPDTPEYLVVEEDEEEDRQHAGEHQTSPVDVEPETSGSVNFGRRQVAPDVHGVHP